MTLRLTINGQAQEIALPDPRLTLLDLLRDHLQLTGAKKGCDRGQCGACTVLVNGRRVTGCLTLAATLEGAEVLTIEGLSSGADLHPMQQAFLDHDALQCGFCTPGQIMSAVALMAEGETGADPDRVREALSGNLCRCGAHPGIVAAVCSVLGEQG
ncbi:(2Fe-2S)-binding protein [Pseudooceanicola sp. 502str34]